MANYREVNRRLWDEWTEQHVESEFYDVEGFKRGDRERLQPWIVEEVGDVRGKRLLHLQCHIGTDTLSWARRGAEVVGLDFSARSVAAASQLAEEVGLSERARFVRADVYDALDALDDTFDVVFTGEGALGWLADIRGWARVAAQLVAPGGFLYVSEFHPMAWTFDDKEPVVRYPYLEHAPIPFPVAGSYAAPDAKYTSTVEYGTNHGVGEIVTAIIEAGLRLDFLHERTFTFYPQLPYLVERSPGRFEWPEGEVPLQFSLKATKPVD